MPLAQVLPADLRLCIDPASLGFSDSGELVEEPLPWIGQERAESAARFGLGIDQPGYNLFVLGEIGSGRSSLMLEAMKAAAATRQPPPDLCYLHNFDEPERPKALRMPAGQGRQLRHLMQQLTKNLPVDIPKLLDGPDFKVESERVRKTYTSEETTAFTQLESFAEARSFRLYRESGRLVFTLRDGKGQPYTESAILALPKERRAEIDRGEQALRAEIASFLEKMRPLERVMNEGLAALRRQTIKPLLDREVQDIRSSLKKQIKDSVKLGAYLDQVSHDVLENLDVFQVSEEDEALRLESMVDVLSRYGVNLVVDNSGLAGAPVIVEDNPLMRTLFGSIEYQAEEDVLVTDFSRVRAGSLLKAHGGFIMLHLRDLLADELVWEKLRRLLRSGRLQIEESGLSLSPIAAVSLIPESVGVAIKIVLIGSTEHYYLLQDADPEFARHFRIKVDFAESLLADASSRRSSAVFVAHTCRRRGLSQFTAAGVARLLESSQREVDDQSRQSAVFAALEALIIESTEFCRARAATLTDAVDVNAALAAQALRHDYPAQRLQESIVEGERLIVVSGEAVGQLNGLTQVDLGDYRFGFPVRVTARTYAGEDGLLNIEREVEMSGPIHDKGVLILHSYLSALFAHIAPLALNASISFEQEYGGVEGDSASCAELYVILSSLCGLPITQGIAVTGAVNQYGQILPVGGINEKIEGYFRTCEMVGLTGRQGVLIPYRNRRHLMLSEKIVEAVAKGVFHVHTADHVMEGVPLLMNRPCGIGDKEGVFAPDSVLGKAQITLQAYRRACQLADTHQNPPRRRVV
jgi:predicted ATP-dependent protease